MENKGNFPILAFKDGTEHVEKSHRMLYNSICFLRAEKIKTERKVVALYVI